MKKIILFMILIVLLVSSVIATVYTGSDGSVTIVQDKPQGFLSWLTSLFSPMAIYSDSNCPLTAWHFDYNHCYERTRSTSFVSGGTSCGYSAVSSTSKIDTTGAKCTSSGCASAGGNWAKLCDTCDYWCYMGSTPSPSISGSEPLDTSSQPAPSGSTTATCSESDDGYDRNKGGYAQDSTQKFLDVCYGNKQSNGGYFMIREAQCYQGIAQQTNANYCDPTSNYCWESANGAYCAASATGGTTTVSGCTDSDGGSVYVSGETTRNDLGTKSEARRDNLVADDYCLSATEIYEGVCQSTGYPTWKKFTCPSRTSCSDGACSGGTTQGNCVDSDGQNANTLGYTYHITDPTKKNYDLCTNTIYGKSTTVSERICQNGVQTIKDITCQSGYECKEGVCVNATGCQIGTSLCFDGTCKVSCPMVTKGCLKTSCFEVSSLNPDKTCLDAGGKVYPSLIDCQKDSPSIYNVTTQEANICSNENHQFCRTWVVGIPLGGWSFGLGSRCSDKEVDLGTPLDCPNPPFETSSAGWTCCEAKQEYRCPSEAEGGKCRESASCLADENAIKTSDCDFVDGSVISMFSISPKTCCVKKTNICSWERGTLSANSWICDGTTNVTCPLSGGQVTKIQYGCGITTMSDNKNTTIFNNGTVIVQQIINNTTTTTTIVEGTSGGSGGVSTTTPTTPTTPIKILSSSLPYTEWKESPIATRLQTLCKDKTDCDVYEDLAGTDKEYYVECKSVSQIQGQLKADVETICADKATYGKYIAIGGGTAGFASGCIVGAVLTTGVTIAGVLTIPAIPVTATVGCIVGGITGASFLATAGSAIGTTMVINCQEKTVPKDVGACIAIPKGQTFGQFQWCDMAGKVNFIKFSDDECGSGTINALIYLVAGLLVFGFISNSFKSK